MNTYNAAGNVGANGGNMANQLNQGQVQKSSLDILEEMFLPSSNLKDLIISGAADLSFGTATFGAACVYND